MQELAVAAPQRAPQFEHKSVTLSTGNAYTFAVEYAPDYWLVWLDPTPAAQGYVYPAGSGPNGDYINLIQGGALRLPTRNNRLTVYAVAGPATFRAIAVSGLDADVRPGVLTASISGAVTVQQDVSTLRDASNNALTPKYAVLDVGASGNNTLIAAVASKKIRVLAAFLIAAGTVNVRFQSGAGGTALTGQVNLVANAGFVLPFNPVGWFETAVNTLLNLELSAAVSVDGSLVYVEV